MIPGRRLKALVTGAAREGGIGRAIVARLEADGTEVVTLDVEPGCTFQVDMVSGELPDLSDIDVLVCNAAVTTMFGAAHTMRMERWQRDLDVNLTGTFRVVQACLPGMRSRGYGRIVVISSTAAVDGMPAQVGYSTTKAGLLGLTKTVAAEVARRGVTVNAVAPGFIETDMTKDLPAEVLQAVPARRAGAPEEVAAAVRFLASDAAGYVTGTTLYVDGGMSA
jgi:NAD(P)-dependent dehydrogenase (short-subunit alcohol dehydrogenase family)